MSSSVEACRSLEQFAARALRELRAANPGAYSRGTICWGDLVVEVRTHDERFWVSPTPHRIVHGTSPARVDVVLWSCAQTFARLLDGEWEAISTLERGSWELVGDVAHLTTLAEASCELLQGVVRAPELWPLLDELRALANQETRNGLSPFVSEVRKK